jgi:hypothetical protein
MVANPTKEMNAKTTKRGFIEDGRAITMPAVGERKNRIWRAGRGSRA